MGFDEDVFRAINAGWANPWLDPVMVAITLLGSYVVVAYAIPLWYTGRKERTFDYLVALAATVALTTALKYAIGRLRPDEVPGFEVRLVDVPFSAELDPAFPSGHVARIAVLAVLLSLHERKFAAPLGVFVVLEGISRIYVGVHWPTDAIGGAAVGAAVAIVFWRLDRVPGYRRVRDAVLRPLGVTGGREGRS